MLKIMHIVILKDEEQLFVACKEKDTGKFKVFLLDMSKRRVCSYDGYTRQWKKVPDMQLCAEVLNMVTVSFAQESVPIYRITSDMRGIEDLLWVKT